MYLIDTSLWIDYLRENETLPVEYLKNVLDQKIPFGITGVIYQEILQGAETAKDLKKLIQYFSSQHFFHPQDTLFTYEQAAKLYFACRRKGVTIRSTLDCLIAQIAIENNLTIMHSDNDFLRIRDIHPKLKLLS